MTSEREAKWTCVLTDLVRPLSLEYFIECHLDDKTVNAIGIPFYTQLFHLWNKVREQPKNRNEYLEQIIWNNKYIKLPSDPKKKSYTTLHWPELYNAGIHKVKHLFTSEMKFIDLTEFCRINNVRYNFLQILRVKRTIPGIWVKAIMAGSILETGSERINFIIGSNSMAIDVCNVFTKRIYDFIVQLKLTTPASVPK